MEDSQADKLPRMAEASVHAGFPSPAQDYMSGGIDLNRELVRHPDATFYVRVSGDSMRDAGVNEGDVLVVDRSLEPSDGVLAICCLDGDFVLRRLRISSSANAREITLLPANPRFKPIKVGPGDEFSVWGVVSWIIHKAI